MVVFNLLAVFILQPALALLPAALFGWMYRCRRRAATLVAALAWLAYFIYEQAMQWRILCSGECNIRVDLLLFYPVLALLSLVAMVVHVRRGA